MNPTLLKGTGVVALLAVIGGAAFWLLRPPPGDVIPAAFRGVWLERGAECDDASAQVRITGTTVNYDRLAFKADGVGERQGDAIALTGDSFASGEGQRETIRLDLQDHGAKLLIAAPELKGREPFVRCPSRSDDQ